MISYDFDEEQIALAGLVRSFFESESPESTLVQRVEGEQKHDRALFRRIVDELGLLGMSVAEERGGGGAGLIELYVTMSEMGRALYGGPFLASLLALEAVVRADTERNAQDLIDSLITGMKTGAVAGLGAADAREFFAEDRSSWSISGASRVVHNAIEADLFVVFAATATGIGVFEVAANAAVIEPHDHFDLTRSAAGVRFDAAPARRLDQGNAAAVYSAVRDLACLCITAEQVGIAERCLEIAVEHAKNRVQFGRTIGSFQAVKHRCADAAVAVEAARWSGLRAAMMLDRRIDHDGRLVDMAKTITGEAAVKVASSTLQVLGGIGYTWEHPLHLYYRRALSNRRAFGDTQSHRESVAEQLFAHV